MRDLIIEKIKKIAKKNLFIDSNYDYETLIDNCENCENAEKLLQLYSIVLADYIAFYGDNDIYENNI